MRSGKQLEDWRVFPLELKDTAVIDFGSKRDAAAGHMGLVNASLHDPTFYRCEKLYVGLAF